MSLAAPRGKLALASSKAAARPASQPHSMRLPKLFHGGAKFLVANESSSRKHSSRNRDSLGSISPTGNPGGQTSIRWLADRPTRKRPHHPTHSEIHVSLIHHPPFCRFSLA